MLDSLKGAKKKWQPKANHLRNVQPETNCRYRILGKCIASVRLQSTRCLTDALRSAPLPPALWLEECPIEFKEYDFTRNPVLQSGFFLQSKCSACGFSILVRSVLSTLMKSEAGSRFRCDFIAADCASL
jgi:hypothetical protein